MYRPYTRGTRRRSGGGMGIAIAVIAVIVSLFFIHRRYDLIALANEAFNDDDEEETVNNTDVDAQSPLPDDGDGEVSCTHFSEWGECVDGFREKQVVQPSAPDCAPIREACTPVPKDPVAADTDPSVEPEALPPQNTTSANCSYSEWSECDLSSCRQTRDVTGGGSACTEVTQECDECEVP